MRPETLAPHPPTNGWMGTGRRRRGGGHLHGAREPAAGHLRRSRPQRPWISNHGCSGAAAAPSSTLPTPPSYRFAMDAARVLLRLPHQDDAMEWKQRQGSFGIAAERGDASSRSAAAAPWMQGRHHGRSPFSSRFLQFAQGFHGGTTAAGRP